MKSYADSHSHLSDFRIEAEVESMIARAQAEGIHQYLQGGVGPEDWQRQKSLKAKYPGVRLCFGLHPYWIADHSDEECEAAMDLLALEIQKAEALGELGLDFRPKIMKDSYERQIEFFQAQLELADVSHKPLVLHLVQAFDDTQRIFDLWGVSKASGMVHSFNGSAKEAEKYLQRDLFLSIGGPVVRPDNQRLQQAVRMIPLEKLLVETDSPDQPPPRLRGTWNEPSSLWDVARMIGQLKNLPAEEVLDISSRNLEKLLSYGNKSQHQS